MGEGKFQPPQLPHFSSDRSETQKIKKHIRDTNQHAKFGKDRFTGDVWATTQFSAVHSGLPFFIFIFFVFFAQRPGRTARPTLPLQPMTRVSGQGSDFWGS